MFLLFFGGDFVFSTIVKFFLFVGWWSFFFFWWGLIFVEREKKNKSLRKIELVSEQLRGLLYEEAKIRQQCFTLFTLLNRN